jgi:hypothetical protein
LELVARAIHADYVRRMRSEGEGSSDDPSLLPWDELPETLRDSNRDQAADIESKLAAVSCEVATEAGGRVLVREFSADEIEQLAGLEHERWEAERLADGWTLGPVKDPVAKRSPYLVPWRDLSEDVRDLDRDTVRRIPQFLGEVGLLVVRSGGT